MRGHDIIKLL